jgi:hypothetical protein
VKPTFRHYLVASDWLPFSFQLIWSAFVVGMVVWKIQPSADSFTQPWDILAIGMAVGIAVLVGMCTFLLPAWLVFGPMYYHQSLLNGAPFVPGDKVMILAGPQRGRISRVYKLGQHGVPRVEMGETERLRFSDYLGGHQLLRVTEVPDSLAACEDESTSPSGQG